MFRMHHLIAAGAISLLSVAFFLTGESNDDKEVFSLEQNTQKRFLGGPRGSRGPEGHRGHRGKHGDRGHRGKRGPEGHRGKTGHTGATGATGPTGATGATGSAGAAGVTGPLPTANQTFMLEDFVSGSTTADNGTIGALGWSYFFNQTSPGSVAYQDSEPNHPGILRLQGSSTNTLYYLVLGGLNCIAANDDFDLSFVVRMNNANVEQVRLGLVAEYESSPTHGIWLEGSPITNQWIGVISNGSSTAATPALGTLFPVGEWDRFTIQRTSANVVFSLGTPTQAFSATLPTTDIPLGTPLALVVQIDTTDALNVQDPVDVDCMYLKFPNLVR